MTADYEYHGLMAASWDTLRGDTSNWADRPFYLDVIRVSGQPALDVGCGTGRLLIDYVAQGIDIDGVDNSPEMLAICRAKARAAGLEPALYEQTMETLDLPRRYRTILVPSSSLQLVVDPDTARRAMDNLVRHLEPGGVLVASFMTLWREGDDLYSEWEHTADREDGNQVRRVARSWFNPQSGCETTEDVYQILRDGEVVAEEHHRRENATRSYTQADARTLFENAGLVNVTLQREFTSAPALSDDALFTVTGTRSAR